MERKIDFVISVRDRDDKRIQRCVDSLHSSITNEIYIVDYNSRKPVNVSNCRIIRVTHENIWNKAHALNIGIRKTENSNCKYIGLVDCDMIIGKKFLNKCKKFLKYDAFIFTKSVYRINPQFLDWKLSKKKLFSLATPWSDDYYHYGVGGIQIFHKDWIFTIGGCDENLTYWGGIDNDLYERAIRTGLALIDINEPILHQDHPFIKEENLPSIEERQKAYEQRQGRRLYLDFKKERNINVNKGDWGIPDNPQQDRVKIKLMQNEQNFNRDYF